MTTKLKDILNEINLHEEDPTADPSTGLSRRVMARLGPAKQKLKIAFGELDDKIIAKLSQLPRGEQEGIMSFFTTNKDQKILLWPTTCPHEGAKLNSKCMVNQRILCPWHHRRISHHLIFLSCLS